MIELLKHLMYYHFYYVYLLLLINTYINPRYNSDSFICIDEFQDISKVESIEECKSKIRDIECGGCKMYIPKPVDTSEIKLQEELLELKEKIADLKIKREEIMRGAL